MAKLTMNVVHAVMADMSICECKSQSVCAPWYIWLAGLYACKAYCLERLLFVGLLANIAMSRYQIGLKLCRGDLLRSQIL
jgi:hypothetical protein